MSTPAPLTLSPSDIAQLADVGRSTVSNWRKRYDDFPQPIEGEAASPRFAHSEVQAWLAAHDKAAKAPTVGQVLWSFLDAWRWVGKPEEFSMIVADLITWRYISDPESPGFDAGIPAEVQWPNLTDSSTGATDIPRVMRSYEETHPMRPHLFNADSHLMFTWAESQPNFLKSALTTVGGLDVANLGEALVSLQDHLSQNVQRGYDSFSTSDVLVDLMVAVTEDVPGPVHDPVVGSGRMLLAVGRRGGGRSLLTGQDLNIGACIQASQRALLTSSVPADIRHGDVFEQDRFDQGLAQVVVMDPPYGLRWSLSETMYLDPRLPYGTPPKSSLDLAWLQLAVWYLGAGGRAFVLQPTGSGVRGGAEAKIRTAMLQAGTIEAIVALPRGVASRTQVPLNLWVLARPGETSDPNRVLFIDHSETPDVDSESIGRALQEWRTHRSVPLTLPAEAISVADLLVDRATLDPRRWSSSSAKPTNAQDVEAAVADLQRAVAEMTLPDALTTTHWGSSDRAPKFVSLTDLEKAGSLVVLRGREKMGEKDSGSNGSGLVTGPWIRGQEESRTIDLALLEREPIVTQAGDVLLQNTGGLAARVDAEGGRVLASPSFHLLRLVGEVLRPEYLAEVLVSTQNRLQAQGAGIQRVRLRDLTVPLIPLAHQDRVVEALAEIRSMQSSAQKILQASTNARESLVDAISAGTVVVD